MSNESLHEFMVGFRLPLEGFRVLLRPGVKRYALLPLLVNALLYALMLALAITLLVTTDFDTPQWTFWGGEYLAWAVDRLGVPLAKLVAGIVILLGAYFTFTAVGMVVASPLNDLLSEKVERSLHPRSDLPGMSTRRWLRATAWSILDSLWIVLRQAFFSVLVLPLLLIPGVGFLPLFLVSAYFAGVGFVDVSLARNFLRHHHKRPLFRERHWRILGFGVAMQLLFMIPLVGLLVLPVGVAAGTLIYCRFDWRSALANAGLAPPSEFVPPPLAVASKAVAVADRKEA